MADQTEPNALMHFGVKGMRWGVRRPTRGDVASVGKATVKKVRGTKVETGIRDKGRSSRIATDVVVRSEPGKRVTATGGKRQPASKDAKLAAAYYQLGKASSVDALSNEQLQRLVQRIELEKKFNNITGYRNPPSKVKQFLSKAFSSKGRDVAVAVLTPSSLSTGRKVTHALLGMAIPKTEKVIK